MATDALGVVPLDERLEAPPEEVEVLRHVVKERQRFDPARTARKSACRSAFSG